MPPTSVPEFAAKKRRACDECRTRKLACSKDPEGCERCKRENATCHYSEQKPMGRPRKRQHVEAIEPAGSSIVNSLETDPPAFVSNISSTLDFTSEISGTGPKFSGNFNETLEIDELERPVWHFGSEDIFGGPPINFSESGFTGQESAIPPEYPIPDLSSSSTDSNQSSVICFDSPSQVIAAPCSCLASMYLSLSSLQEFPSDIALALKTVRTAAATASAAIWCSRCGSVVLNDPNPPIESFQNTMLLGTILPIIANGYHRLLKLVDDETEAADAAGLTKTYRISDYGGLSCHQSSLAERLPCVDQAIFEGGVDMPAHQWRTAVRALLRVDIYGHEQGDFKHKGLKDLVTDLESRQKLRHEFLDAYVEAGGLGHGMFGQAACQHQKASQTNPHGCLQILNMAKVAIDTLVIA